MRQPEILDHAATLADATRCRVLQLLESQELTVSELCAALQLPQSTVSRHLKLLGDGGWLRSRREATSHFYQLDAAGLEPSALALWRLIRQELAATPAHAQDARRLERILAARRSRSQEFFSATAAEWDRLRDELFGAELDLLALPGLLDPAAVIGDLACGTGRVAAALAPFVARLIAVDASTAMLDAARKRLDGCANVDLRTGSLEALPIEDAALDGATLFLALHHLPDPVPAFHEARRVLRPGGRLLVVDMMPHDREEYRKLMGHVWLGFSPRQIADHFSAAGFEAFHHHILPVSPLARGPVLFAASASAAPAAPSHAPRKPRSR